MVAFKVSLRHVQVFTSAKPILAYNTSLASDCMVGLANIQRITQMLGYIV